MTHSPTITFTPEKGVDAEALLGDRPDETAVLTDEQVQRWACARLASGLLRNSPFGKSDPLDLITLAQYLLVGEEETTSPDEERVALAERYLRVLNETADVIRLVTKLRESVR